MTQGKVDDFIFIVLINKIGNLVSTLVLEEVLEKIFYLVEEALEAKTMFVALFRGQDDVFFPLYFDEGKKINREDRKRKSGGLVETVAERKETVVINSFLEAKQMCPNLGVIHNPAESSVSCPLIVNGAVIGVLSVQSYQTNFFNNKHKQLLEVISVLVASAIKNAEIHKKVESEVEKKTRELKDAQAQIVQAEKMAALGIAAAGISHEIKNAIQTVAASAETLKDHIEVFIPLFDLIESGDFSSVKSKMAEISFNKRADNAKKKIKSILKSIERVENFVAQLGRFVRKDSPEKEKFIMIDLEECAGETLLLLQYLKKKKNINVEFSRSGDVKIMGNRQEIIQVFTNVVLNAYQAVSANGNVWIKCSDDGNAARVEARDDGVGISQEALKKVFDPFFTTKPAGEGTGLGLAICQKIIGNHGGQITVSSEGVGKGAAVTLIFPKKEAKDER